MFSRLVKQLSEKEGLTETLKAENQMLWVQKMNNLRNAAMEIVSNELIAVENEVARNMYERSELDYLIYNAPLEYADLILNGDPETYLKTVTEYKNLD